MMDESTVLNGDKCYICLSPFEKQTVGSLDQCEHVFCLDCILQWSKTANTCPVDRMSFAFIHQRRFPGGVPIKRIKVRTKKGDDDGDDDEGEGSSAIICEECGRSDRRHRLVVCLHCDSSYHRDCLPPSLTFDPEGYWMCAKCVVSPQHTDSMVEEEISDGELADLLAEVDITSSPSSRLRPSTINRPSSSTEPRHSQRLQSRASPGPRPRTRPYWHVPKHLLRASTPAVPTDEGAALHHSAAGKSKTRKKRKRATYH